jgi:hypothetical protein
MWHRVALVRTIVSEERIDSIIRVKKKKPAGNNVDSNYQLKQLDLKRELSTRTNFSCTKQHRGFAHDSGCTLVGAECRYWRDFQTQRLKNKSAATALITDLASMYTQMTLQWTSWRNPTERDDCEDTRQIILPDSKSNCFLCGYSLRSKVWPPLWSSGQSSWLLTQRSRVRFPALPDFLSSSGSGTGSTQPLWE